MTAPSGAGRSGWCMCSAIANALRILRSSGGDLSEAVGCGIANASACSDPVMAGNPVMVELLCFLLPYVALSDQLIEVIRTLLQT